MIVQLLAEELFRGSPVVFVSALGVAAFLLSENVRWRFKRFVGVTNAVEALDGRGEERGP